VVPVLYRHLSLGVVFVIVDLSFLFGSNLIYFRIGLVIFEI